MDEQIPIHVVVVCPQTGMQPLVRDIRQWCSEQGSRMCGHLGEHVSCVRDLTEACNYSHMSRQRTVYIPLGYHKFQVENELDPVRDDEVIIRPPRPSPPGVPEVDEPPYASLLPAVDHTINVQHTLPALRKILLRQKLCDSVTVRYLESEQDLRQYLELRYRVWKEMGYLHSDRDCYRVQWELDHTDRTALPVGAFDRQGNLVGCARLVFCEGQALTSPAVLTMLESMIQRSGDEQLAKNWQPPGGMMHQFDMLRSFPGFADYYRELATSGASKAEVSRVIVAPEYRHHGLGEALVDSLLAVADQKQVAVLFLACMKESAEFYGRCGFRVLQGMECDSFTGVRVPAIAMVRCAMERTLH